MLLLTNPNDPLGFIYKPSTVMNAISWARSKNIHTIMDEIFALTVHKVSKIRIQVDVSWFGFGLE